MKNSKILLHIQSSSVLCCTEIHLHIRSRITAKIITERVEKKSIHWFFIFPWGKGFEYVSSNYFFPPNATPKPCNRPLPATSTCSTGGNEKRQDIYIVILKLEQWRLHMSENFSNRTLHNEQLIKDPIKVKQSTDDLKSSLGLLKRNNIESKWRPGLKHNYGIMNR